MRPRRRIIPQRTPIFLGCEGESEQAYGQVLNDLLREAGRPIHLEVVNLNPGAGDPMTRLRKADKEIDRRQRRRTAFRLQAVLMDSDQVDGDGKRRHQAEHYALDLGIRIIWQEPCHEALLLRHLDGCAKKRPMTSGDAGAMLKTAWPEYRKPMTKLQLAQRIDLEAVRRAAAVEPALHAFLRDITLLQ
jgi:hypothetical protein